MPKKYFIIAEKGEVARAIRTAIPEHSDGSVIPEGEYRVVAASGHLLELKLPEEYDEKYKKWRIEDLPIGFPDWNLVPKKGRDERETASLKKKLADIKDGLKWCDVAVNCGDPDDEGQLIVDELLAYFGYKGPCLRLRINNTLPEDIVKEVNAMDDNRNWEKLGQSAAARRICDAMFGYNYTRYFSVAHNSTGALSVGRVQTPTLGLVVARDAAIEGHIKAVYFELETDAVLLKHGQKLRCKYVAPEDSPELDEDGHIANRSCLEQVIRRLPQTATGTATRRRRDEKPPLPFNLLKLQVFCESRFGYDLDRVMAITQKLREYGLITYNRSTVQYLNTSQFAEAPVVLKSVLGNLGIVPPHGLDVKNRPRCFDDKKMEGQPHHAIIPTAKSYNLSTLAEDELKVYKSICLYYIIQFLPDCRKERTELTIPLQNGESLVGGITRVLSPGYTSLLREKKEYEGVPDLSGVPEGPVECRIEKPEISEHETKPPRRYTKASLAADMSSAVKYVQDPEVKRILLEKDADVTGENGSIGTSATRGQIIDTLIRRGYVEESEKGRSTYLISTEKGRSFYAALPESIKTVDVTAGWWYIMQGIQSGSATQTQLYNTVMDSIKEFLANPPATTVVRGTGGGKSVEVIGKCPRCGRDVIEGKKGYGCTGWKDHVNPCKFTIWKISPFLEKNKKKVTPKMAKDLLSKGICDIRNLTSRNGRRYDAKLRLNDTGNHVNLDIDF